MRVVSGDGVFEPFDEPYDFAGHDFGHENEYKISFFVSLFILLLMICMIFSNMVTRKFKIQCLPEAGAVMLIGMIAGVICLLHSDAITDSLLGFNPTIFFVAFLPPIIFNSGYSMKRRFFFDNFVSILAYAIVGTLISTLVFGGLLYLVGNAGLSVSMSFAECLTFGSLISANDPVSTLAVFQQLKVDPLLFYLVFGESVLNDAVAIVLFRTFSKFIGYSHTMGSVSVAVVDFILVFVGSTAIGISFGCLSSLLFKHVNLKSVLLNELVVYLLFAYLPFLVAETVAMSGIVAILFTGITMKHYTHNNLSDQGREGAIRIFNLLATLCETSVFLNLGLSVFALKVGYHFRFIGWSLIFCLIARVTNVYPISFALNCRRETKIELNQQHMLCFSGLRGAVAFALSVSFPGPNRNEIIATTMCIVLFTVYVMGGGTVSMLNYLKIKRLSPVEEKEFDERVRPSKRLKLLRFDSQYLMPFFTNRQPTGDFFTAGNGAAATGNSGSLEMVVTANSATVVSPASSSSVDGQAPSNNVSPTASVL